MRIDGMWVCLEGTSTQNLSPEMCLWSWFWSCFSAILMKNYGHVNRNKEAIICHKEWMFSTVQNYICAEAVCVRSPVWKVVHTRNDGGDGGCGHPIMSSHPSSCFHQRSPTPISWLSTLKTANEAFSLWERKASKRGEVHRRSHICLQKLPNNALQKKCSPKVWIHALGYTPASVWRCIPLLTKCTHKCTK